MNDEELQAIAERAKKATEGPWKIDENGVCGRIHAIGPIQGFDFDSLEMMPGDPDAEFIAHAREDVPALIAEVRRLREMEKKAIIVEGDIDPEMRSLITELNNAGLRTTQCCSGHGDDRAYLSISLDNVEDLAIRERGKRVVLWWDLAPASPEKSEKCPHCNSPMNLEEHPFSFEGFYLGRFKMLVCSVCQRRYHPKETSLAIEEAMKLRVGWKPEKSDTKNARHLCSDCTQNRSCPVFPSPRLGALYECDQYRPKSKGDPHG